MFLATVRTHKWVGVSASLTSLVVMDGFDLLCHFDPGGLLLVRHQAPHLAGDIAVNILYIDGEFFLTENVSPKKEKRVERTGDVSLRLSMGMRLLVQVERQNRRDGQAEGEYAIRYRR